MISGEGAKTKLQEYAATSMNLTTREEILSAMVVYGFVSYYKGKVYIPNKELMDIFDEMLQATIHGDTDQREEILAIGISYEKETKVHRCKVEEIR